MRHHGPQSSDSGQNGRLPPFGDPRCSKGRHLPDSNIEIIIKESTFFSLEHGHHLLQPSSASSVVKEAQPSFQVHLYPRYLKLVCPILHHQNGTQAVVVVHRSPLHPSCWTWPTGQMRLHDQQCQKESKQEGVQVSGLVTKVLLKELLVLAFATRNV